MAEEEEKTARTQGAQRGDGPVAAGRIAAPLPGPLHAWASLPAPTVAIEGDTKAARTFTVKSLKMVASTC